VCHVWNPVGAQFTIKVIAATYDDTWYHFAEMSQPERSNT